MSEDFLSRRWRIEEEVMPLLNVLIKSCNFQTVTAKENKSQYIWYILTFIFLGSDGLEIV